MTIVGSSSQIAASPGTTTTTATRSLGGGQTTNLGDILERVLDKGLVIAGDIRVNLLDIELLTIKLRIIIASLDTAKQVGINWWESDPWLNAQAADRANERTQKHDELEAENRRLRSRIEALESVSLESGTNKRSVKSD
jgi:Gas vesicle protein